MTPGDSSPPTQQYSIPEVEIGKVLGLVELLKSKGGHADIYRLAHELNMEFGETLAVIRGAELLKLVHTPGGDVVLEALGDKVTKSSINQRKKIIKTQLELIPAFQKISQFLRDKEDHEASRADIVELVSELIPNENAEQTFALIVNWGRYAELFGYNDDTENFYLDDGEAPYDE